MPEIDPGRVAVAIVNYNGGEYIINCLHALAKQTQAPDIVVVVDNASTDGSLQQVREDFPDVELIELEENIGFAGGNNRAFEKIDGCEWVALINPDTVPQPDWFEALLAATERNPGIDVFASKLVDMKDSRRIDGTGDVYHVCGLSWRRHHGMYPEDIDAKWDPVFSPCAAAAMCRLDAVRSVGGFDEAYFCYNEDVDLMFRMRLMGIECAYVENSVVHHMGSGLTGRDSDFCVYHGHRNLVWTYVKNMPGLLFWWYLPQHLLLNLITVIHYTLRGRARVICRSKWHALTGMGYALRKRAEIQKSRKVGNARILSTMTRGLFRPYFSRFR